MIKMKAIIVTATSWGGGRLNNEWDFILNVSSSRGCFKS